MTNARLRLAYSTFISMLVFVASAALGALAALGVATLVSGCASGTEPAAPDAAPVPPIEIAGHYSLHSRFAVTAPPAVDAVIEELEAMTDGADDPARYLIDRLIAKLPEGRTRDAAVAVAPYLSAYLTDKLATVAPSFATGTRALASGLDRIAHRFETSEALDVAVDGRAVRVIDGLRWGPDAVDATISPAVTSVARTEHDALTIATHAVTVPYGTMLRLGLEHSVIPSVVPHAYSLTSAFARLADCAKLGAIVSEWVGLGSPAFYERACSTALTAAAAEIEERIDALDDQPFVLELSGTARAIDRDGDGSMDGLVEGRWMGAFGSGTFDGTTR